MLGRIAGQTCRLEELSEAGSFRYDDGSVTIVVEHGKATGLAGPPPQSLYRVDMGRFHAMVALLAGITHPSHVQQVNTRLLVER